MGDRVTIADVHGDFREFRGEMRARMDGVEATQAELLELVRKTTGSNNGTAARLHTLEEARLPARVQDLEARWRVAIFVGGAVALMVAGLFADLLRGLIFGG